MMVAKATVAAVMVVTARMVVEMAATVMMVALMLVSGESCYQTVVRPVGSDQSVDAASTHIFLHACTTCNLMP